MVLVSAQLNKASCNHFAGRGSCLQFVVVVLKKSNIYKT